jgi:hypothetical protein
MADVFSGRHAQIQETTIAQIVEEQKALASGDLLATVCVNGPLRFSVLVARSRQTYMFRETNIKDICVALAKAGKIENTSQRAHRSLNQRHLKGNRKFVMARSGTTAQLRGSLGSPCAPVNMVFARPLIGRMRMPRAGRQCPGHGSRLSIVTTPCHAVHGSCTGGAGETATGLEQMRQGLAVIQAAGQNVGHRGVAVVARRGLRPRRPAGGWSEGPGRSSGPRAYSRVTYVGSRGPSAAGGTLAGTALPRWDAPSHARGGSGGLFPAGTGGRPPVPSPGLGAAGRPRASPGSGSCRTGVRRRAPCSHQSTVGSPRALTRPISRRQRRCSTSSMRSRPRFQ